MEEKILEIFRSVFNQVNPEEVILDSEFRDWDQFTSLTLADLLVRIEEAFEVKLKLLSLVNAETVQDVLDAIEDDL